MQAWANIRCGRRTWRVCPWVSIRSALVAMISTFVAAIVVDHWILAGLERRGLVASDGWKRHNRVVIENHQKKDRHWSVPHSKDVRSSGVRAWVGHPVFRERTKQHRLLVMGDSFVWESPYLTLNHMWWRQLEIELNRRGYHDVEVIAAGSPGMSTHEQLDLAKKVVPDFQPDLIVWGFVTNDPDERLVKQIHSSQLAPPIPGRIQSIIRMVVPRLLDLFLSRRNDKLAKSYLGPTYGYEYSDWLKRIHEGENLDAYKQTVKDVGIFQKQIEIPGILVTLPESPITERFAFSYDKVLPLWWQAGLPVIDHLPAFVAKYPDAKPAGPEALVWGINPADGHPGPRSTAFLARQTVDRLEQDYPQVLGRRSSRTETPQINDWLPFDLDLKPVSTGRDGEDVRAFEFAYPRTDASMPTMPLDIPTVLFALEQPIPLRELLLSGSNLKSARIWLSTYDPVDHYDTEEWHDLGFHQGNELNWTIPAEISSREVSVILLHAELLRHDSRLILELRN